MAPSLWILIGLLAFFIEKAPLSAAEPDNPYSECALVLLSAGSPPVNIRIYGELHSEAQDFEDLIRRAQAGEFLLILDGAPYGSSGRRLTTQRGKPFTVELSKDGPIYGAEDLRLTMMQEFKFYFFRLKSSEAEMKTASEFYATEANQVMWLRLIETAARNPSFWKAVRSNSNTELKVFDLIERLVQLGDPTRVLSAIREEKAYPRSADDHLDVVKALMKTLIDSFEQSKPHLAPFLSNLRATVLEGDLRKGIAATGDLVMMRDVVVAENLARIIKDALGSDKSGKDVVLLFGQSHVEDLRRIIEREFDGIPNVEVFTVNSRMEPDPASLEVVDYILSREPPSLRR